MKYFFSRSFILFHERIKFMAFHESYSNLLTQLPPSLIKAGWIRLTTRKKNSLSENEASSINPIIESFLKHEINRYQKNRKRCKKQHFESLTQPSPLQVIDMCPGTSSAVEEEINARVKETTDNLRYEFTKSTQETLKSIKQQKDIECKQIKLDMANKSKDLFESTLKKYIRDGTIYYLIHQLEEKDGKLYPDISK